MIQSGIPYDMNVGIDRRYKMISQFLEMSQDAEPSTATRKSTNPIEVEIEEPSLKKAERERAAGNKQKVTLEHTVNQDDVNRKN